MGHKSAKDGNVTEIDQPKSYNLTYLDASQPIGDSTENNADFITNIEEFKKGLPIIEVPQVELPQC